MRTIPDNTWVEVVPGTWFATWQTNWILVDGPEPTATPSEACRAGAGYYGCRGTVRNANIDSTFSNIQSTDYRTLTIASSVFLGAPMSGTATLPGGGAYWGTLWRLERARLDLGSLDDPLAACPHTHSGCGHGLSVHLSHVQGLRRGGAVTGSYPA